VLLACAVVSVGFFVGVLLDHAPDSATADRSKPSSTTSILGIAFGLISSLTTASHAIVIKRSLTLVNGDAIELAWYSNVLSSMVLIPIIWLVGEGGGIIDLVTSPLYTGNGELSVLGRFLWGSLVTGIVGWLLSIAGVLSIKITSPITHMISSAVRGILQSAMGVWAFGDIITTGRGTSILVILTGSMYYTWAKNEELLQQREREQHRGVGQTPLTRQPEESALVFDADRRESHEDGDLESGYDLGEARHRPSRGVGGFPLEQVRTPEVGSEKTFDREK
jgi:solute carrier family 35 (GDP-fucose transporter), member C1